MNSGCGALVGVVGGTQGGGAAELSQGQANRGGLTVTGRSGRVAGKKSYILLRARSDPEVTDVVILSMAPSCLFPREA